MRDIVIPEGLLNHSQVLCRKEFGRKTRKSERIKGKQESLVRLMGKEYPPDGQLRL